MYEMMIGRLPFYSTNHEKLFEMILTEPAKFPRTLPSHSRDILSRLLEKSPRRRLGGGERDAADVMEHPFFSSINWKDLFEKKIPPPWKPNVEGEDSTQYFETVFTREAVTLTPPNPEEADIDIDDPRFRQFQPYLSASRSSMENKDSQGGNDSEGVSNSSSSMDTSHQLPRTVSEDAMSAVSEVSAMSIN